MFGLLSSRRDSRGGAVASTPEFVMIGLASGRIGPFPFRVCKNHQVWRGRFSPTYGAFSILFLFLWLAIMPRFCLVETICFYASYAWWFLQSFRCRFVLVIERIRRIKGVLSSHLLY